TAFVASGGMGTGNGRVSTIDVKTRTTKPGDITVGPFPFEVTFTPDGETAFVANSGGNTVSTINVKTRTKNPTDITVGMAPGAVAFAPDGKTAFVTNTGSGTISTINVKTRTKNPDDIPVGSTPGGLAVTPDGKTLFVVNFSGGTVSTIDLKTKTKTPDDIPVGSSPFDVAVPPCRRCPRRIARRGETMRWVRAVVAFGLAGALVGVVPNGVAAVPAPARCQPTAFVANAGSNTVSAIDVKAKTRDPTDIAVGVAPVGPRVTPDGKALFVTNRA